MATMADHGINDSDDCQTAGDQSTETKPSPTDGSDDACQINSPPDVNRHVVLTSATGERYAVALQPTACSSATGMGGTFFIASGQSDEINTSQVTVDSGSDQDPDMAAMNMVEVTDSNCETALDGSSACLVCGDRGSGYHYSVYSCEGCKGFFKRTVQKNMKYMCKETGICQINKYTRNSCQHCRFQRCLDVGMRKEAVREDRTPGGKHRAKKLRLDDGESTGFGLDPSHAAEVVNSEEDELFIRRLVEARPDIVPGPEDGSTQQLDGDTVELSEMMGFAYLEVRYIIEWAKKVPGFSNLKIEDQMAMLKSSFMELCILRLAQRSLDCHDTLRFSSVLEMSLAQCKRLGWGEDLFKSTVDFINRIKGIQFDLTEFCILNAVVLAYPDAPGLVQRKVVMAFQNHILELLEKYSASRYADSPRRHARILLRLPALRSISAKAAERFLSFTLDGDLQMSSLVLEMIN